MKNACVMWMLYLLFIFPMFIFSENSYNLIYFNNILNSLFFTISLLLFIILPIKIFYLIKYKKINNDYLFYIINNILLNILFWFSLYQIDSTLLLTVSSSALLINGLLLFIETKKISNKTSNLLIPYLLYLTINIIIFITHL